MSQVAAVMVARPRAVTPGTVNPPPRVAVISKNAVTRAGLRQLVSQGGDRSSAVVRPVRGGPLLRSHDVIILDLTDLTDLAGANRSNLAVVLAEGVPVVVLTHSAGPDLIEAVLSMGAVGTVSTDITGTALRQALERAAAGRTTDLVAFRRARSAAARATARLTDRELVVLELIGTGLTNQNIADRLYLSINTVKTYIRSAYRKIGVTRRAEAVLWAVHHQHTARLSLSS